MPDRGRRPWRSPACLPGGLSHEGQSHHRALAADAVAPGGRVAVICRVPCVLAIYQRHSLAILREQPAIRNVHHLQQLGIVGDCSGTEYTFCAPFSRTFTVKVAPAGCVDRGGSKAEAETLRRLMELRAKVQRYLEGWADAERAATTGVRADEAGARRRRGHAGRAMGDPPQVDGVGRAYFNRLFH